MTTESPKRHEQRRQRPAVEGRLDERPLAEVAEHEEDRHDDRRTASRRRQVEERDDDDREVGGDDGQVAVGQVDRAHDAEQQRQAAGGQRVQPAEQDPWMSALTQFIGDAPRREAEVGGLDLLAA